MNQALQLPSQVAGDLATLERRAGWLAKHGKRTLVSAGILAGLSASAYGLAAWLTPSLALSAVHLPAEILSVFPEALQGASSFDHGGLPFERVATVFEGLGGVMSAVGSIVIAAGFGMVGYRMAFKGETFGDVSNAVVACAIMGTAPMMVSWLIGGEAPSGPSARDQLVQVAKNADYPGILKAMDGKLIAPHLRDYVLLQAALIRPPEPSPDLAADQARRIKSVRDALVERLPLSADPKTMYALETRVAGSTQSAIAKGYYEQGTNRAGIARFIGSATAGALLLSLLAAAGMLGLSRAWRSRIRRVSELLNPKRPVDAKDSLAVVDPGTTAQTPATVDLALPIETHPQPSQDGRHSPGAGRRRASKATHQPRPRVRAGRSDSVEPQGVTSSFDVTSLAAVALGTAAGLTLSHRDAEASSTTAEEMRAACERPSEVGDAEVTELSACEDNSYSASEDSSNNSSDDSTD